MLRAIQNLGCSSSGWLLWKPRTSTSGGFSFISVSTRPFSYSSSSSSTRAARTNNCSFLHEFSACKTPPFRRFRARSESNPDAASASSSASVAPQSSLYGNVRKISFCQWCGGPTKHEIPSGEEKMRAICTVCGKIAYQNPKMLQWRRGDLNPECLGSNKRWQPVEP